MRRSFSLTAPDDNPSASIVNGNHKNDDIESQTVLRTEYRATTNRMLRVAVNGFMESLGVVLNVMEELDMDVLKLQ